MRERSAAVVFLVTALVGGLAASGECWAQTKLPRVGILTIDLALAGDQVKYWWGDP